MRGRRPTQENAGTSEEVASTSQHAAGTKNSSPLSRRNVTLSCPMTLHFFMPASLYHCAYFLDTNFNSIALALHSFLPIINQVSLLACVEKMISKGMKRTNRGGL